MRKRYDADWENEYEFVGEINNGFMPVVKDRKWGYIDQTGAEVVPCEYEFYYAKEALAEYKAELESDNAKETEIGIEQFKQFEQWQNDFCTAHRLDWFELQDYCDRYDCKAFKNSNVMNGYEAYNFIKENAKNLDEVLDILMEINPYDNCGYFIVTHDKKLQEASGENWDDIFEDFCSEITHDSNKFMDLLKDEGY